MKKFRSIDEYTKEELYHELQRERAISECLRQEISDIKDIIRMQNYSRGSGAVNQMNLTGDGNSIVQNGH